MRYATGLAMLGWIVASVAYVIIQDRKTQRQSILDRLTPYKRAFRSDYLRTELNVSENSDAN
jgi:hypothetical protein